MVFVVEIPDIPRVPVTLAPSLCTLNLTSMGKRLS
jgi:hypothetical protein